MGGVVLGLSNPSDTHSISIFEHILNHYSNETMYIQCLNTINIKEQLSPFEYVLVGQRLQITVSFFFESARNTLSMPLWSAKEIVGNICSS